VWQNFAMLVSFLKQMQFTLILQNEVDDSIFLLFQSSKFWKRFPGEAAREVRQRLSF
jgi:hypothetical protein